MAYEPENTLPSFALAVEQGADGIELDVQLTLDGEVVVAHDERLERVSDGKGWLKDYTLAELKRLNFGLRFGKTERIPTLAEVYALVRDTGIFINVELKTTEFLYHGLPEKLLALEREYDMQNRVLYSSFNHYSLTSFPETARKGLLYESVLVDPWLYARRVNAAAIHPYYKALVHAPGTVARCHEHKISVHTWTADDPDVIKFLYGEGADAVITNTPDVAVKLREAYMKNQNVIRGFNRIMRY
jgi:glycerophosphoryl diester phosphodiesterase